MNNNITNTYLLYLGLGARIDELPKYSELEEETLWFKGYIIELSPLYDFLHLRIVK